MRVRSEEFEDGGVGHAAGLAHGLQAVADSVVAHVVHETRHEDRTGATERVTDADGTAERVETVELGAGLGAVRAGTSMGSAASTAYKLGQETSGSTTVGAGIGGMAAAAKGAAANRMRNAFGLRAAAIRGQQAAWNAGNKTSSAAGTSAEPGTGGEAMPGWARKLHSEQASRHRRQMAIHAIQAGDRGGAGATPDIKERD